VIVWPLFRDGGRSGSGDLQAQHFAIALIAEIRHAAEPLARVSERTVEEAVGR